MPTMPTSLTTEIKEAFRRLEEDELRWQEQHWQDSMFEFQMRHQLSDQAMEKLMELKS
jgi:hypothetical protein